LRRAFSGDLRDFLLQTAFGPELLMDTTMSSRHVETLKVGLFGIGLDTYWPQFEGLKDRLVGYIAEVAHKLARPEVEIVNLGLIDTI
jgi:hypothetical protein